MDRGFPRISFGICPRCSSTGGDDPDASGADVAPSSLVGNGQTLEYFRGFYWCPICIKEELAKEESEHREDWYAEEEEFRAKSGFINEVSDDYI
jgi:hypothetical protein